MIYCYARVSTTEQNLDRQLEAFKDFNPCKIFSDKQSGKDFERLNYQKMKKKLTKGDTLIVKSLDRFGRNYDEIIKEFREITDKKVSIKILDMPLIDTTKDDLLSKFISDIVLQILSFVAENERVNIKQRQAEGIRIAKEKGIHMGRPRYVFPPNIDEIINDYICDKYTLNQVCEKINCNRSTFLKFMHEKGLRKFKKKEKVIKEKVVKEKGIHMGRPRYVFPPNIDEIINDYICDKYTLNQVCEKINCNRSTFLKFMHEKGLRKFKKKEKVIKEKVVKEKVIKEKVYKQYPNNFNEILDDFNNGKISAKEGAAKSNMSDKNFYKLAQKRL